MLYLYTFTTKSVKNMIYIYNRRTLLLIKFYKYDLKLKIYNYEDDKNYL